MSYVWSRAELMTKLSMNQTAEGVVPAAKGGHNRDVWQERILAQVTNPYHQLSVRCDMDAIRVYDELIEKLDGTITLHARLHQSRDYQPAPERAGHRAGAGHDHPLRDGHGRALSDGQGLRQLLPLVKGSVASAGRLKGLTGGKMGNAYLRWAFGEVAVICKRAHRLITPMPRSWSSKHGTFKGNAILANQIARAVYYMLQSGQAFDAERMVAHRS
jgi:hypothetical protein